MKPLKLEDMEPDLEEKLEQFARQQGMPIERAALTLLRQATGLEADRPRGVIGNSMDHLIGTWTAEEAEEFDKAVEVFEQIAEIDESLWT
jgi:hypothetical protein